MSEDQKIVEAVLRKAFFESHTTHEWTDAPFDPKILDTAWEHAKWAPTAFNSQPLRITVADSKSARQKLVAAMVESNQEKTAAAPSVAILSYDPNFVDGMEKFGAPKGLTDFVRSVPGHEEIARTSANIQAGYLITTLRALGAQIGPMGGADMAKIDETFNKETGWHAFLVINLGSEATEAGHRPRTGRPTAQDIIQRL